MTARGARADRGAYAASEGGKGENARDDAESLERRESNESLATRIERLTPMVAGIVDEPYYSPESPPSSQPSSPRREGGDNQLPRRELEPRELAGAGGSFARLAGGYVLEVAAQ